MVKLNILEYAILKKIKIKFGWKCYINISKKHKITIYLIHKKMIVLLKKII